MISIEEFRKLEIKTAKIREVKHHPRADKLYILVIDVGSTQKQIVAGIRNFYSPEDLVGKNIVIVDNLSPAVIRGIESQGMLLAVQDEKGISLITPDRDVPAGSLIK
jgi:methionyl-tRNA synthetase